MNMQLTVNVQVDDLADVKADPVAGVAQVVAVVLLLGVLDGQRPVGEELPVVLGLCKRQLLVVSGSLTCGDRFVNVQTGLPML